ncbi:Mitochondrial 2-oxodicarboxylate carrier [Takifugu flavidus]|uniref:Mitochondrial 2-oxodicarboxylate carrier n=1 Tax=Takifugu flavidus TaxID=433684 RepID=A0A5C6NYT3_9TELE|nr:Mitochondrial 2-oxodicarboxylate carrier [Takifugu flavidus]
MDAEEAPTCPHLHPHMGSSGPVKQNHWKRGILEGNERRSTLDEPTDLLNSSTRSLRSLLLIPRLRESARAKWTTFHSSLAKEDEIMKQKLRFQIQRGSSDPNSYKSLGDCFRTIFRNEGIFGFYKGILPPIVAETPKRAVKFFTFEQYKKLLNLTPLSPGVALSVAGLGAGLTEAVVVNPFEVVKVSLQANRDAFKEQPSSFAQARRIIKTDGFGRKGLNKGLTSTLGRHGVFNMIYFGFYFNVKDAIPTSPVTHPHFLAHSRRRARRF